MELKEIRELIKLVSESGVAEVELERGDFKIAIKKNGTTVITTAPAPVYQQAPPAAPAQRNEASAPAPVAPVSNSSDKDLITIKSPMIGTFYQSPSPDKASFVKPGDDVKPGKVVCIIEAMKLFNEIESEVSGKIVKILVENASPVEYDQPLFLVEPA